VEEREGVDRDDCGEVEKEKGKQGNLRNGVRGLGSFNFVRK